MKHFLIFDGVVDLFNVPRYAASLSHYADIKNLLRNAILRGLLCVQLRKSEHEIVVSNTEQPFSLEEIQNSDNTIICYY